MATSGTIQTNTDTNIKSYFWVKWEQVGDQDVVNNRTKIKWSCGFYSTHNFYKNAVKMSAVSINGEEVYSGGTYSNMLDEEPNHTLASGELWISHNTDGTKTFTISSFTGWLYKNNNYSSAGGSYSLTSIPRQATITAAPNFTDQDNPTISYSNPAGTAVAELMACISLTGSEDDIAYRNISKTGTSYTFNLTDAERDLLRNNTPGTSRTISFHVRTKIGGTYFWHDIAKTFSINDSTATKPDVSMSVSLNNSLLPSAFGGLYVQGKSKVDLSLSATGKYNASIKSYWAVVDGKTYSSEKFTSDVLSNSGKIIGYAKDSRGFTGTIEQTIDVIEYSKPLVVPISSENAILCYRSDGNGKRIGNSTSIWIKAKRSYYSVSGKNKCALQWRWKSATEAWDNSKHLWNGLISRDVTTNEYNAMVSGVVFDLMKAYTVQIRAIDDIGEYDIKTFEIPTQDVALHLGKGGKNVSVGTYCDYSKERTFYSDWDATFGKSVSVGGTLTAPDAVINGVYMSTKYIASTQKANIKTKYNDFSGNGGNRQSLFLFGTANAIATYGVGYISNNGGTAWSGTADVALTAIGDGIVEITLPTTAYDTFIIISAEPIKFV